MTAMIITLLKNMPDNRAPNMAITIFSKCGNYPIFEGHPSCCILPMRIMNKEQGPFDFAQDEF